MNSGKGKTIDTVKTPMVARGWLDGGMST